MVEPALESEVKYQFVVESKKDISFGVYLNDEKLFENQSRELSFNMLESRIRITIAEFAAEKVFLHAGVVSWKGRAIILPATSFSGKTTLVAELVKKERRIIRTNTPFLMRKVMSNRFPNGFRCGELLMKRRSKTVLSNQSAALPRPKRQMSE